MPGACQTSRSARLGCPGAVQAAVVDLVAVLPGHPAHIVAHQVAPTVLVCILGGVALFCVGVCPCTNMMLSSCPIPVQLPMCDVRCSPGPASSGWTNSLGWLQLHVDVAGCASIAATATVVHTHTQAAMYRNIATDSKCIIPLRLSCAHGSIDGCHTMCIAEMVNVGSCSTLDMFGCIETTAESSKDYKLCCTIFYTVLLASAVQYATSLGGGRPGWCGTTKHINHH